MKSIKVNKVAGRLCQIRRYSAVDLDKACELLDELSRRGSQILRGAIKKKRKFKIKSHKRDLVTQMDKDMEQMIIRGIKKQFPDHEIIGEEGTEGTANSNILGDAPTWIIDPIDGTTNFVHGFPFFCISIAFYVDRKPMLGCIENPMLRQTYVARRGRGSYCNGRELRVSGQRHLKKSLINVVWPATQSPSVGNIFKLLPIVHGTRALGSTALHMADVAAGASDAHLQYGAHIWDWAAGVLLIREAGGVVLDPCGGEFDIQSRRMLAAATPELAEQIIPLVEQVYPPPDGELKSKS